jgi:hypothetical protein
MAWLPSLKAADIRTGESFFCSDPRIPPPGATVTGPQIFLSTYVPGAADAWLQLPDGTEPGQFTAQLLAGPAGTPLPKLLPLSPSTTFQTAASIMGPYEDVVGATSPMTVKFEGTAKFYRLKPYIRSTRNN